MINSAFARTFCLVLALASSGATALAQEIKVVSSGGFAAAYRALAPEFERRTGYKLSTAWGHSMGNTVDAVPSRLARGEAIDVVIMVGYALTERARRSGTVARTSRAPASARRCARVRPSPT